MKKTLNTLLHDVLVLNKPMARSLYEWELEEHVEFWRLGMHRDKNDFLYAVTENSGHVAMLLMNTKGELFINEEARQQLQLLWSAPGVYASNMKMFIPDMVACLKGGDIWVTGVTVIPDEILKRSRDWLKRLKH